MGMPTLLRRLLVLVALMFWQGGFTFYAAVVVPIGQQELGSHLDQGFITRRVTNYLNLRGVVAVVLLAWDMAASSDRAKVRYWVRWVAWVGLVLTLAALSWLHQQLDQWLSVEMHELANPKAFRSGHRWYLWLNTLQWVCGLVYVVFTLWAWSAEDRRAAMRELGVG